MKTEITANFDAVGEMLGTLQGLAIGLDEQSYMEDLIEDAHDRAASAFDLAAAATARAGGGLSHVYEFGTAGITPGQVRFDNPVLPEARLYIHTMVGHGGVQEIGYSFRPARVPNPEPTPESTGVDAKYLQKLSGKKYVFWNRAFVTETGQEVSIGGKGNFIFVPFRGAPSYDAANTKGFVLTKKQITATPGRTQQGAFTAFWMNWWAADGNAIMSGEMKKFINEDILRAIAQNKLSEERAMKPVQAINVPAAFAKAATLTKRFFGSFRRHG